MSVAVQSFEQTLKARYATARANVRGPAKIINLTSAIKAREELIQVNEVKKPECAEKKITGNFMRRGTKARFYVTNTVSYWCFGMQEPMQLKQVRDMFSIAQEVLVHHEGMTIDEVRLPNQSRHMVSVRRAIAEAIHKTMPDTSMPQIGRFLHRDHTSVLNLLGKIARRRKAA